MMCIKIVSNMNNLKIAKSFQTPNTILPYFMNLVLESYIRVLLLDDY